MKTTAKVVAVLAALLVVALILGGGKHGPWRHLSFEANPTAATGSDSVPAQPSSVTGNN
ncbi:MAG: hypothetical protein H7245_16415 [Candidatus Saccharibacteria bacterium]|nr:hypothetical protein [Pseudorhodobacter sp.]